MSWIPAFKLGFWNAWLLTLGFLLLLLIPYLLAAFGGVDVLKRLGDVPTDKRGQSRNNASSILLLLLILYSIFLPLKLSTPWLYAGCVLWLAGMALSLAAFFTITRTAPGHIFRAGVYRFSRHPLYLSVSFIFLGISLASASWLFFLLVVAYMALQRCQVQVEESDCLRIFGDEYAGYLAVTPRWLGLPRLK